MKPSDPAGKQWKLVYYGRSSDDWSVEVGLTSWLERERKQKSGLRVGMKFGANHVQS